MTRAGWLVATIALAACERAAPAPDSIAPTTPWTGSACRATAIAST